VKRIVFGGVVALPLISPFGTKVVGQAFTLLGSARRKSSTPFISRLNIVVTTLSCLGFLLFFCSTALAQSQPLDQPPAKIDLPDAPEPLLSAPAAPQQQTYGTVSGRVVDQIGNGIVSASVKLACDQECVVQEVQSDDDGQFAFP